MTQLFAYPKSSAFGRVLPKTKIYAHGNATASIKRLFVQQVEKITWSHKLAPETINISATKTVQEIEIFTIALKEGEIKTDVLRCIDRAIPFPILFELTYGDKVQPVACFKRPSEADSTKWVISEYFFGEWQKADTPRPSLPVTLNLGGLYEALLAPLLPYPAPKGEKLPTHIARLEAIAVKERELAKQQAKLNNTKQFNRKVAINAEIRGLKQDLTKLLPAGNQ